MKQHLETQGDDALPPSHRYSIAFSDERGGGFYEATRLSGWGLGPRFRGSRV